MDERAAAAEHLRQAPGGQREEGDHVLPLADGEREVGLGQEEVEAHRRHQRGDEGRPPPAELGHHDGEGEENEGEVGGRHDPPQRDQQDAQGHGAQRSRDDPGADIVGSAHGVSFVVPQLDPHGTPRVGRRRAGRNSRTSRLSVTSCSRTPARRATRLARPAR